MGGSYLLPYAVAFLLATSLSFLFTPIIRKYGTGNGFFDNPDERKIHNRAIPRLGGVAIYAAFVLTVVTVILLSKYFDAEKISVVPGFLLGCTIILGLGIYDDLKGANAYNKFLVQIIASIILYYLGFRIERITNPFGVVFNLGWFSLPFTIFWIVGITNAINLIDGIDGLAAGASLIACFTLVTISYYINNPLVVLLGLALGGAVLGFIPYNRNPASIFMGDSGSLVLGFAIACLAILGSQKSHVSVSMLVPIITLGLPIMDTLLAIMRRYFKKTPLFSADKEHCHHKLLEKGYSHKQVLRILYILCLFFGLAAFSMTAASDLGVALILMIVVAVVITFIHLLGYIEYLPIKRIKRGLIEKPRIQQLDIEA